MKKIIITTAIAAAALIFYGCGQEMNVTIYNTSGIAYGGAGDPTYIQMSADIKNMAGTNKTVFPSGVAMTEDECNDTNSFTLLGRENDTLHVYAQGYRFVVDGSGNTSLEHFEAGPEEVMLYGAFMDSPHWYAAVYVDNIIIYKK